MNHKIPTVLILKRLSHEHDGNFKEEEEDPRYFKGSNHLMQ